MAIGKVITPEAAVKIPSSIKKQILANAPKICEKIGKVLLNEAKAQTLAAGAVASKTYLKGWRVKRRGNLSMYLSNVAGYSGFVERGRGASTKMPPMSKIMFWAKRKLGITNLYRLRRVAFAIAKAIKANGVKGRMILAKTIAAAQPKIDAIIRQEFVNAIR